MQKAGDAAANSFSSFDCWTGRDIQQHDAAVFVRSFWSLPKVGAISHTTPTKARLDSHSLISSGPQSVAAKVFQKESDSLETYRVLHRRQNKCHL